MSRINRRIFLQCAAATAGCAAVGGLLPAAESQAPQKPLEFPADVKITAITTAKFAVRHPRKIGRNSFKDHGAGGSEPLVRVETSAGIEGLGSAMPAEALGKKLGDLLEARDGRLYLRPEARKLIPVSAESALLDIVGKLTKRPAAELLGPIARRQIPCYDGSIYMRDLDDGDPAIAADTTAGMRAGHSAFKIKIGRGNWLKDRDRGYQRDLWAIQTVRATAGARAKLLVDANNYYTPDEAMRLVSDTASTPLYWMEEMFSEERANHDKYRALRNAIKERKLDTLLADGESGRGEGDLLDLLKEGVVQVSQPDIRALGIFGYLDYAEKIRPFGATVGPHTWAKMIGVLEACILGMVAPNFAMVEDCHLSSEVVKLPGLRIQDGFISLEGAPGLGIEIVKDAYEKECAPQAKTIRLS
ncbi:MAG: hypothetical protein NTX50_21590 [Candidatus Sumerlaeota bacterium]|nr:hypothetical protein [Candidatus Sumerlaeota bacterium]